MHLFLTGGTGLIGSFLVPRLLSAFPDALITLLVRGIDDREGAERFKQFVTRLPLDLLEGLPRQGNQRLRWIRGDVSEDDLGIAVHERRELISSVTHIIHGAASIRFDQSLEDARAINCGGTRRMLDLALRCADKGHLRRFLYIGTSSVSGQRSGVIYEDELETGQRFFNAYEQSKAESERLVHDCMELIPATVVRPSIVIGDSQTGRTTMFNVIYIPMRLMARGLLQFLPGDPTIVLDLVPVDWVDDAIVAILKQDTSFGKVFHLTAGPSRAVSLQALVDHTLNYFESQFPLREPRRFTLLAPEEYRHRRRMMKGREDAMFSQLDALLPYITINRFFDTTNVDPILTRAGIRFPLFEEYADRIFAYCVATDWGKRELGGV